MASPTVPASPFRSLDDYDTLRTLARNLGDGFYITDRDGRLLDANPAFLALLGIVSLAELAGVTGAQLVADPARRAQEMAILARDGAVRSFEMEIVRPDGARRIVLDTTWVCRDRETGATFHHGILVDITRQKALEHQLREQSVRDALTGCYNRRILAELAERLEATAGASWACIFIDIDHFKQYNDRHGHEAGDRALVQMTRFLTRNVRGDEPVVRLGGTSSWSSSPAPPPPTPTRSHPGSSARR